MLYPTIFGEGLFDDLMNFSFPRFRDFDDTERKLYGKNAAHVMKTDVREHDDQFEVDIDLPGFKKEEIQLNLESGYLTVSAEEDIKAKFEDGVLKLNIPKKEAVRIPEKKTIMIEG